MSIPTLNLTPQNAALFAMVDHAAACLCLPLNDDNDLIGCLAVDSLIRCVGEVTGEEDDVYETLSLALMRLGIVQDELATLRAAA